MLQWDLGYPLLCLSMGRPVPVPVCPSRRPRGTGGSQKLLTDEELFAAPSDISGRDRCTVCRRSGSYVAIAAYAALPSPSLARRVPANAPRRRYPISTTNLLTYAKYVAD